MKEKKNPPRWQTSDTALRSVQVAFDVDSQVIDGIRSAAFSNHVSTSDQIRKILGLSVGSAPKRQRLTVSLSATDYEHLGERYGLASDEKLAIKAKVIQDLTSFVHENSLENEKY